MKVDPIGRRGQCRPPYDIKNPPFPWKQGISLINCSPQYAGDGVPYGPISIRRADTSDQSGGFSSPYGSQNLSGPNWPPALPGDRSGGFARVASSTNHQVRIPYAERKLATGREVLLDCRQAKSIRHEFVSGDSPPNNKRTTRGEGGPFIRSRRGEPGSVGRGNIIRALRTRHRHYNKQSKFRQSLESKKMNRFQNII